MKTLVTGAAGNIGISTIRELMAQNCQVCTFDIDSKPNRKKLKKIGIGQSDNIWGDITNYYDVVKSLKGIDVVIHLAAIIPPVSNLNIALSEKVNVEGTKNLVRAIRDTYPNIKLVFASSNSVYGNTQNEEPPVIVKHSLNGTDPYSQQKITCERLLLESELQFSILRLAAVPPVFLGRVDVGAFEYSPDNRIEFTHTKDVGLAFVNMAQLLFNSGEYSGLILNIAGGKENSCWITYGQLMDELMKGLGLKPIPRELYGEKIYYTDWLETVNSQELLKYQRFGIKQFIEDIRKELGWKKLFITIFSMLIQKSLERKIKSNRANNANN